MAHAKDSKGKCTSPQARCRPWVKLELLQPVSKVATV